MNLRTRIRDWLGITDLSNHLGETAYNITSAHEKLDQLLDASGRHTIKLNAAHTHLSTILLTTARTSAKLDPQATRDPMSADMKAESDVITEREIARLRAEQAVREQYHYTPKSE